MIIRALGVAALVLTIFFARDRSTTLLASSDTMNRVTLTCQSAPVYQRNQVDSIVQPGIQVSAHMHDFYGRSDVSDFMFATATYPPQFNDPGYTPRPGSCANYGDWAGYWFPSSKWNGVFIKPLVWNGWIGDMLETWQAPVGVTVELPPFGMAYVVKDLTYVRFTCGQLDGIGSPSPFDCTSQGGLVTAELTFPDCFNGNRQLGDNWFPAGLDPTHFAYSSGGTCPSGYPVRIAQLITQQHFLDPRTNMPMVNPLNTDGSLGLSFSSGAPSTYHGDFLNSWAQSSMRPFIDGCLNKLFACPKAH